MNLTPEERDIGKDNFATAIGGGVSLASGLTNPQIANLIKRLLIGFAGGLLGGLLGSLLGACIFGILQGIPVLGFLSRVLGWTLIGCGIGVAEGIADLLAGLKLPPANR